jgi:hypothetical protein
MTKQLLLAAAFAAASYQGLAQCTPDQLYADSLYGVWPDTTADFATGYVGAFYSDTLNLLVPTDAGVINPGFAGFVIDSVQFTGIDNLPPGLSVGCNSQTAAACTYITGAVGCGLIEGTPTTAGSYDVTLNVLAYTTLGGTPLPVPQSFTGYTIVISSSTGINDANVGLAQVRNVPNPFSQSTTIEYTLQRSTNATVRVYNLLGDEVWMTTAQARAGLNKVTFEPAGSPDGIYLYKVQAGNDSFTGRMVFGR